MSGISTQIKNEQHTPLVTYNMLLDALRPNKILLEPSSPIIQSFRWVSSMHWERGSIPEENMIIVCKEKSAQQVADLFPKSLLITLTEEEEGNIDAPAISSRMMLVKASPSDNLLQRLQDYFLKVQDWENQLSSIECNPDSLMQVLIRGGESIDAPCLVYDNNNRFIAASRFNKNAPVYKVYLKHEAEVANSLDTLDRSTLEFTKSEPHFFIACQPVENEPGKSPYHLVAIYEKKPTPGQRDVLSILAYYLSTKSNKTAARALLHNETYELFNDLIHGKYITQERLEEFTHLNAFSLDSKFRLVRFMPNDTATRNDPAPLINKLKHINHGKGLLTIYREEALVLLHAKMKELNSDNDLSTDMIEEELSSAIDDFKGGYVAISQVFDNFLNLNLAYQQTEIIAKYREVVDFERLLTVSTQNPIRHCYTFEDVLMYALVDSDITQEMKDFFFSYTMLKEIVATDIENNSDDIRVLATYLFYERKASLVAKKLHMHRNTVIYRIDKIEKRFGVDFDENWLRERVKVDLHILYCKFMRNPETYANYTKAISGSVPT